MAKTSVNVDIQARWMLDAGAVPGYANQFLVQPGAPQADGFADGFYVTAGHINPPAIDGPPGTTPDIPDGSVFPVIPFARFYCSRDRLINLRDSINDALEATGAAAE